MTATKPAKNVQKCSQIVRRIKLEEFRLTTDGPKKWKSVAERRKNLLLLLSTWANGDGTFSRQLKNGETRNFSPSEKTLLETIGSRASLYRLLDSLKELKLLSWDRKDHHSIRQYTIHLPEQVSNQVEQVSNQPKNPENTSQITQEQVSQLVAPSVSYPSLEEPSEEPSENQEQNLAPFDSQRPDSEFVTEIALEVCEDANITLSNQEAIDRVLARTTLNREQVSELVRRIVEPMDDFQLKNAGSTIAAKLPAPGKVRGKKKQEAKLEAEKAEAANKRIDQQAAEHRLALSNLVAGEQCGICGSHSCDCL